MKIKKYNQVLILNLMFWIKAINKILEINLYKQIQMCFLTVHENKLILILGPQYFSPILEEFLQNKEGNINVLEYYCKYA